MPLGSTALESAATGDSEFSTESLTGVCAAPLVHMHSQYRSSHAAHVQGMTVVDSDRDTADSGRQGSTLWSEDRHEAGKPCQDWLALYAECSRAESEPACRGAASGC